MRSVSQARLTGKLLFIALAFVTFTTVFAAPCAAQFGIGGRLAFYKTEAPEGSNIDEDFVRYWGGHIRLRSSRWGLEASLDRRSEDFELLNERVVETPIQVSALLFLARGGFSPYLLGGPGWYSHKIESLDDDAEIEDITSRDFGWHAGFGAELRMGRHAALHGDYRYTFLDFDGDDDDDLIGRLFPGHKGSMWTAGFTVYF